MFTVYLGASSGGEPSDVPTRPPEARNKSGPNRVTRIRHHDGNRLGRLLGRTDRWVPSGGNDDINLETDELGR